MAIKVFSQEFVNAVSAELSSLRPGAFITTKDLVEALQLDKKFAQVISVMLDYNELPGYEAVIGRGIRRIKGYVAPTAEVVAPATPAESEPVVTVETSPVESTEQAA